MSINYNLFPTLDEPNNEDIAKCHFHELYPTPDKETGAPIILPSKTSTGTGTVSTGTTTVSSTPKTTEPTSPTKKLAPKFDNDQGQIPNIKLVKNENSIQLSQSIQVYQKSTKIVFL